MLYKQVDQRSISGGGGLSMPPARASEQPVHTLEHLAQDSNYQKGKALHDSLDLIHNPESKYHKEFQALLTDVSNRLINGIPEDLKKNINPDEIKFRLTDSDTLSAYVVPTENGKYEISISKGLLNTILNDKELTEKNLVIDCLAAVVAHEISHTIVKRSFKTAANTLVEESFCDRLPAIMLQNANFNPSAMSLVCDLIMNAKKNYKSEMNTPGKVHASTPLRKEIYEKSSFAEYQKYKKRINTDEVKNFEKTKTDFATTLKEVVNEANKYKITLFTDDYLKRQGYHTASDIKKAEIIVKMSLDYYELLSSKECSDLQYGIFRKIEDVFRDLKQNHQPHEYEHILNPLSKLFYKNALDKPHNHYREFCTMLGVESFGLFKNTQELAVNFINAKTEEDISKAALVLNEHLNDLGKNQVYLYGSNLKYIGIITPKCVKILENVLNSKNTTALTKGESIPIPFKEHNLLFLKLEEDYSNPVRTALSACAKITGISLYMRELEVTGTPFSVDNYSEKDDNKINPLQILSGATNIASLSAYKIDVNSGIRLRYPHREDHSNFETYENKTDVPPPPLPKASEEIYAKTKINAAKSKIDLINKLDKDNIYEFFQEHYDLIIPVFSSQQLLSEETKSQLRAFPEAFYAKAEEIAAAEQKTFKDYPFKSMKTPMLDFVFFGPNSYSNERIIYKNSEASFARNSLGLRTDPLHPINQHLLNSPDIDPFAKILAISHMQGLDHRDIINNPSRVRNTLIEIFGSEEQLLKTLGVDHTLSPKEFINNLARNSEPKFYSVYITSDSHNREHNFYTLRKDEIRKYILSRKPEDFKLEELHELLDLAKNQSGYDEETKAIIHQYCSRFTDSSYRSSLTTYELIHSYQRLKAMSVLDWEPDKISDFHIEIEQRIKQEENKNLKQLYINEMLFPKPYQSNEQNPIVNGLPENIRLFIEDKRVPSSLYTGKITDQRFEKFLIAESVALLVDNFSTVTNEKYDQKNSNSLKACENIIHYFNDNHFYGNTRAKILTEFSDQVLLQKEASFYIRDHLYGKINVMSKKTIFDLVEHTHGTEKNARKTNLSATVLHNGIIGLRGKSNTELRNTFFEYLSNKRNIETENKLAELICSKAIEAKKNNNMSQANDLLETLGISRAMNLPSDENLLRTVKYHLLNSHEKFSGSPLAVKATALSVLAVDNDNPNLATFNKFNNEVLLPRILPRDPKLAEILKDFTEEYFKIYSESVHHQYLIACSVLGSEKDQKAKTELEQVGEVIKSFLSAHSAAGYKLLQRIHSHPDTPEEIKNILADTKYQAVKYTRWEVHETLDKYHPEADNAWIGKIHSGSICLSVPLINNTNDMMLSLIHPGTRHESFYWLDNFEKISNSLKTKHPQFSIFGPMIAETRRMMIAETDFDSAAKIQQENAENSYDSRLEYKDKKSVVQIGVPEQFDSYNIPGDSPEEASGCKLVAIAKGKPYLEILDDVKKQYETDGFFSDESLLKAKVLYLSCFSAFVKDTELLLSGKAKDHDLHGGNLIIDFHQNQDTGFLSINVSKIDHGCMDLAAPEKSETQQIVKSFYDAITQTSLIDLFSGKFGYKVSQNLSNSVWHGENDYLKSASLGVLATLSLNEELSLSGKPRRLMSNKDLLKGVKIAAKRAHNKDLIPVSKGFKPWLLLQVSKFTKLPNIKIS